MTLEKLNKGNELKNRIDELEYFLNNIKNDKIGIERVSINFDGRCIRREEIIVHKDKDEKEKQKLVDELITFFSNRLDELKKNFQDL